MVRHAYSNLYKILDYLLHNYREIKGFIGSCFLFAGLTIALAGIYYNVWINPKIISAGISIIFFIVCMFFINGGVKKLSVTKEGFELERSPIEELLRE